MNTKNDLKLYATFLYGDIIEILYRYIIVGFYSFKKVPKGVYGLLPRA